MIVLDTHIWLWWVNREHERLTVAQRGALEGVDEIGVSAVSCFEIAHAVQRRRIALSVSLAAWFEMALAGSAVALIPLTPPIAARAVTLTDRHGDPFDRIIMATALELDGRLATADGHMRAYPELAGRLLA
jgi:PIN domain nuclease of toxin-antitoxin system